MIFNSIYGEALEELHGELVKQECCFQAPAAGNVFWSSEPDIVSSQTREVCDCTFVNDECVFVLQRTASQVARKAPITAAAVKAVFES